MILNIDVKRFNCILNRILQLSLSLSILRYSVNSKLI